jgi:hypothetical protein
LRRARAALARRLRLHVWFPHVPLALVVALAGVLEIVPTVEHLIGTNDADNAFVVLAVKELGSPAKTVAAVNDSNNLGRVQRVQPDLIIAPQVLGGELLAMVLSGENPDSRTLIARLLHMSGRTRD